MEAGETSNWWLHHALQSLGRSLESLGGKLVLRQGDSLQVLKDVVAESGAKRLYWRDRRYEGSQRELDARIKALLSGCWVRGEEFQFNSAERTAYR